jgi:hypothetical protein
VCRCLSGACRSEDCKANGAFAEGKPDDSVLSWTRPRNGEPISSISPTTDRRTLAVISVSIDSSDCSAAILRHLRGIVLTIVECSLIS